MNFRYHINPDKEQVKTIKAALKENDWYCPCALEKNADSRCMCADFRENVPIGEYCHCGLYCKEAAPDTLSAEELTELIAEHYN